MEQTVNERIKIFAEHKNLSQSMISEATGISQPQMSKIFGGVSEPHKSTLKKICAAYPMLSETWLFQGKGEMLQEVKKTVDEALVKSLKDENAFLKRQLEAMQIMVETYLKPKQQKQVAGNFNSGSLNASKEKGRIIYMYPTQLVMDLETNPSQVSLSMDYTQEKIA